jgi:hypothetical protein
MNPKCMQNDTGDPVLPIQDPQAHKNPQKRNAKLECAGILNLPPRRFHLFEYLGPRDQPIRRTETQAETVHCTLRPKTAELDMHASEFVEIP